MSDERFIPRPRSWKTTYGAFKAMVEAHGWTTAEIRCDEAPSPVLLEAMEHFGLNVWEKYVLRLIGEGTEIA